MRVKIIVYLTITTHWGKHIHFQPDFRPLCTFLLPHRVWKSPNMSHLSFSILAFSTNFCPTKIDLSGNTVWPQASRFQKHAKLTIFDLFNLLLSIHNINVARFFRNVVWDFFLLFSNTVLPPSSAFQRKSYLEDLYQLRRVWIFSWFPLSGVKTDFPTEWFLLWLEMDWWWTLGRFGHTLELSVSWRRRWFFEEKDEEEAEAASNPKWFIFWLICI